MPVSRSLCLTGSAFGVLSLAGWAFGVPVVTTFVATRPAMMPNTAVALIALGAAGSIGVREARPSRASQLAAIALSLIALSIGLASSAEYVFGVDLGIDQFLFPVPTPLYPGRPSPLTAVSLTLLGLALTVAQWQPRRFATMIHGCTLTAAFVAFVSLVGHMFGAGRIYLTHGAGVVGVALPSAIALLLVSAGILLRDPAVMALVTGSRPAGLLVRRFGVLVLVGIPVFGVVAYHGVLLAGLVDVPLTLAILTVVSIPFVLVLIVVTARELDRAYAAVDASREQARTLVEESADGIFIADLDGRFTAVNVAGCRLLGVSRDQIVGTTIVEWIPDDERQQLADARTQLLNGDTRTGEWHLRRHDGTFVPVEVSSKILQDGRWQAIVRDISRRRAAEEGARRSEARLEGIISIAADAIISIDEQQRIVMFNQGAERIFGWRRDEILGQSLDVLIPHRFRDAHRGHVAGFGRESASARMMSERGDLAGVRKGGEEFPAEAAISQLRQNGTTLFTVFLRDVTGTRRLQEELRRNVAARDEILSVVAHDLRGPLAAVRYGANILSKQVPAERRENTSRTVEGIRRSIGQATRLVDDLLDVASIDAGSLRIEKAEASPKELVDRVCEQFAPVAADASVQLDTLVDPGVHAVGFDAGRIQQVLSNLVENAIRFTPPGGRIRITVETRDPEILFTVSDTGCGIPPEHLSHLFDRFWQAEHHRRGGAGLGLAISKGIVEAHGGRLSATSIPGQGSSFEFSLPVEYSAVT